MLILNAKLPSFTLVFNAEFISEFIRQIGQNLHRDNVTLAHIDVVSAIINTTYKEVMVLIMQSQYPELLTQLIQNCPISKARALTSALWQVGMLCSEEPQTQFC